ncbi:GntR family transcriptional regulator [Sphingobium sp.]|uniref:GntR family transcriptional regulator n=1 Tax=Sphingobium sp. TaxID=1912891 RepID=UPI0028BEAB47|nr:GntR family transcriptional regulator [Sphingobium sp.]
MPDASPPDPLAIVRAELTDGFLTGRYVPGQKLIEAELTSRLGLSRAHVREALGKLDVEGIVTVYHYRGTYVRRFSDEEAFALIQVFGPQLVLAARLAAGAVKAKADCSELAEIREMMAQPATAAARLADLGVRDRFYRSIANLSGNPFLEKQFPATLLHLLRMQVPWVNLEDHGRSSRLAICDAILAADDEDAARTADTYSSALLAEIQDRLVDVGQRQSPG